MILETNSRAHISNLLLAALWAFFIYAHVVNFWAKHKISLLPLVMAETFLVFLFLSRKDPISTSQNLYDYFVAFFGTFVLLLYRPTSAEDVLVGQLFVGGGSLMLLAGYISLNRSFGLVAANRGVKMGGMYRFVRHPVYLSYFVMYVGYVLNNPSLRNVSIIILSSIFQILRILQEEDFLLRDEEYLRYTKRVPWRLVPYLF